MHQNFDPFVIQVAGQIAFLIKIYWKSTPSIPLPWANLSTLQVEVGIGGRILENDYTETQQWLQTESWILEVWKFMSTHWINIFHLGSEVSTQHMHDACLTTHLAIEGDFTTSELRSINWCCMSKGILFISNISNHQGTHLQQSATYSVKNFNLIL